VKNLMAAKSKMEFVSLQQQFVRQEMLKSFVKQIKTKLKYTNSIKASILKLDFE